MTPTTTTRSRRRLLAALVPVLVLAACGSDSDDDATTAADTIAAAADTAADPTTAAAGTAVAGSEPAGSAPPSDEAPAGTIAPGLEEYCAVAIELTEQESLPTPDQLERYAELAPDEIAEPTAIVVAAFAENPDDPAAIFGDPETGAALEELTAFEAEQCGLGAPQPEGTQEVDPDATQVELTAADYSFEFEAPTSPGRYSFVMTNDGAEPHLMILLQLEEGVSLDEVMASEGEQGVLTMFESSVATPGAEAVVTADLGPGRWVMVCPIPDADGVSHAEHGMATEFTVS